MAQRERFEREDRERGRDTPAPAKSDVDRSMLRLAATSTDPAKQPPRDRLIDLAGRISDTRRQRSHYFDSGLLGEPVWDMLLALFCLPAARWKKLTVSGLMEVARVPLTTGLRWSKVLEEEGLIVRIADPLDARRCFIALSEKGEQLMFDYLSSIYDRMAADRD